MEEAQGGEGEDGGDQEQGDHLSEGRDFFVFLESSNSPEAILEVLSPEIGEVLSGEVFASDGF